MSKRKVLLIIIPIVFVFLAIGGIFLWVWQNYQNERKEEFKKMLSEELPGFNLGVLPKGFTENQTPEGIILENKDIGIGFKVPAGWTYTGYMDKYIDLTSSGYKADPKTFNRISGCETRIQVDNYITFPSIAKKIENIQNGSIILGDNEEIIKISGKKVLKITEEDDLWVKQKVKKIIKVNIPLVDTEIYLTAFNFIEGGDLCIQEFDDFLNTISIK